MEAEDEGTGVEALSSFKFKLEARAETWSKCSRVTPSEMEFWEAWTVVVTVVGVSVSTDVSVTSMGVLAGIFARIGTPC